MLHFLDLQTPFIQRQTNPIPCHLSTCRGKLNAFPKKGPQSSLNLSNNRLGQDKQRRPINLNREQNRLDQLKTPRKGESPTAPTLCTTNDPLNN